MKLRKNLKIVSRSSSITNSFVQSILPSVQPSREEIAEALATLGMTIDNVECSYCGAPSTDWDHLYPLVRGKRPTGYINEIRNLVPSCGPCNQSKGGADWRIWMLGDAKGSPKTKGVPDLQMRIERIDRFVAWGKVEPLAMNELGGSDDWEAHWRNLEAILAEMREAQKHADKLKLKIQEKLNRQGALKSPARADLDLSLPKGSL